jgi:hypothetical protein
VLRHASNSGVPAGVTLEVLLETTLDVICRIIASENESNHGRRYGHPVIDIAREVNRYMHPEVGYAGPDRNDVTEALSQRLFAVLGRGGRT